jgi:hypothetical protein
MKHRWWRSKEVFDDNVVIDDRQFYPGASNIKVQVMNKQWTPPKIYLWRKVVCLAYQGKDIVLRFIIEYSSLNWFWPLGNNRSIFIWVLLKDEILACVETWN